MKGLLLKDLYTLKGYAKQYAITFVLMAGWTVYMKNMFFLIIYAIVLGGMLVLSTLSIDEAVHFDRWSITTPAGVKGMIREKYVLLLLLVAAGTAAGFLLNLVLAVLLGGMGSFEWEGLIITGMLFIIAYAVMLPVNFKLGVEKARYVYIGTILGAAVILTGAFKLIEFSGRPLEEMIGNSPVLMIVSVAVCVLALSLSYTVSLKMVRNREW